MGCMWYWICCFDFIQRADGKIKYEQDWFLFNNNNIRYYTPDEYVCGQYTVDMINASERAGFKAYFGAIIFSDNTGLQQNMGKKVTEVTVYGYYDDAGDKDPATWRFAYPLYTKMY